MPKKPNKPTAMLGLGLRAQNKQRISFLRKPIATESMKTANPQKMALPGHGKRKKMSRRKLLWLLGAGSTGVIAATALKKRKTAKK